MLLYFREISVENVEKSFGEKIEYGVLGHIAAIPSFWGVQGPGERAINIFEKFFDVVFAKWLVSPVNKKILGKEFIGLI